MRKISTYDYGKLWDAVYGVSIHPGDAIARLISQRHNIWLIPEVFNDYDRQKLIELKNILKQIMSTEIPTIPQDFNRNIASEFIAFLIKIFENCREQNQ